MMLGMMAANAAPTGSPFGPYMVSLAPYLYYKLDETGTLTTATDSSGNGRNGTYSGTGTTDSAALFSGSTRGKTFNGSGHVSAPNATLTAGAPFSVVATVKATGSTQQCIASSDTSTSPGRLFQLRTANSSLAAEFLIVLPTVKIITGTTNIRDGNAHMVVATYDESVTAANGRMKLYVDGVMQAQSTTAVTNSQTSLRLAFGAESNAGATRMIGDLDECAFFTRALSASEVATLWANRNTP